VEQEENLSPQKIASKWKLALALASKHEKSWRETATKIYKLYTPKETTQNSFNILWPNTETLRQAVYNSLPKPEVKRRYRDEDKLGKSVAEVLERALEFTQETYDFDQVIKSDVLCMLLAGRSVSRARYVPSLTTIGSYEDTSLDNDLNESESYEEIDWEQVVCEHIQWDDFRILSPAKKWADVTAIAFKHKLNYDDLKDKFGEEIASEIVLELADDDAVANSDCKDDYRTAEVWEIWDKDEKMVHFICQSYPKPLKSQEDPLGLQDFFPIPRPLYAIENDDSLIPAPLYSQYEQQAKELNRICLRINKLISALRVRGIYDATLSEMSQLMKQDDNGLLPAQNVTELLERGGLDKAIWMMPIDQAANVLQVLTVQRNETKQIIYELTGISDIMRSASDPAETFGAQKIKTQWGTQRLQKMQAEVQRYIRDLMRIKAEIIAEKFQPETLEKMTLVKLPHQAEIDAQNQQMMQQWAMQAQSAQMQGQPVPPQPQLPPPPVTWEAVIENLRDDSARTYRIGIETDSTLAASQDSDMAGLRETLTAVTQLVQGLGPAVQAGAIPVEGVKEVILAVLRRAKLGTSVEEAFDKMQAPKPPAPPPDPNAGKMQIAQLQAQQADQQAQREMMMSREQAQLDAQVEAHKQQVQAQQIDHQNQLEAQRAHMQSQQDAALEQMRIDSEERMRTMEQNFELLIAKMNNQTKIDVALIGAGDINAGL
jgi:hypothetical protein